MIAQALFIGMGLGLLVAVFQATEPELRARLVSGLGWMLWMVAGLLAAAIAFLWFLLFSRISWRTRLGLAVIGLAVLVGAAGVLQFEGFAGDLTPKFSFVWPPFSSASRERIPPPSVDWNDESRAFHVVFTKETPFDFPGFLGATRDGIVLNVGLASDWQSTPPKELWRRRVGAAWSGCAIVGDHAVTQEQRGDQECVVCYELLTGNECWVHGDQALFTGVGVHGDGPRATPTIHQGRVYSLGATGLLNCLEGSTGKVAWSTSLLPNPQHDNLRWGLSGSPLIVGDLVVVAPGVRPGRSVVAFDQVTGQEIWAVDDFPAGYSSLQVVELDGVQVILNFHGTGLAAHDPQSGKTLWQFPWVTQGESMVNVAQPLKVPKAIGGGELDGILISTGYGQGIALLVPEITTESKTVRPQWRNKQLKSKFSNMVVCGEFVYGLDDGVLACLELKTGKRFWRNGRYGHGQLLRIDNLILVQAESGEVVLVEASSSELKELGRLEALPGKTWNHPALAKNRLLVRNDQYAACFELPVVAVPGERELPTD